MWHGMQLCSVFKSDLEIVMDKSPLDRGPWENNTVSYSRSLHASSTMEIFLRENFCKVSVATKITKIFYYENLALYVY